MSRPHVLPSERKTRIVPSIRAGDSRTELAHDPSGEPGLWAAACRMASLTLAQPTSLSRLIASGRNER